MLGKAFMLVVVAILVGTTRAAAAGAWQAPLRPMAVTRGFQPPPTPYAAGHRGVDLGGIPGQPVLAAATGVVGYAGPLAGRGVVVIVHGTLRTTYEPVRAEVQRGVRVARGQRIGVLASGHPGCPGQACLHWGLLRGDTYLDPLSVLKDQQVRLLPLAGVPASAGPATPVAANAVTAPVSSLAPVAGIAENPGVTWSAAALAGAGVVMLRRRR
jgi:murein DD-endopeptidase MepM/ murein hydrolase activator NlpD